MVCSPQVYLLVRLLERRYAATSFAETPFVHRSVLNQSAFAHTIRGPAICSLRNRTFCMPPAFSVSCFVSNTFRVALAVVAFCTICIRAAVADDPAEITPEQRDFVTSKVLPLLESRCLECHKGPKEPKGGLVLTGRDAILRGGESGPAIVPGKPDESLLVEAIRYRRL